MRWLDRLLAFLDDPDPGSASERTHAFEIVLVLLSLTELWTHAIEVRLPHAPVSWPLPVFATLCGVAACLPAWRRLGFPLLALCIAVTIWNEFPTTGNHVYLECFLCSICAFLDPSQKEEERLLTQSVRWVGCVILFYAGVQKAVHGYYTTGLMPAFFLHEHRFERVFTLLLPAAEAQRIQAYNGLDGSGPYLVSTPLWLLASNLVWIFEIALAAGLFVASTRTAAVLLGIAFVVLIETGAREVLFGLLFVNLLMMFLRTGANRRLVPIAAVACAIVILIKLGWLPAMEIH